MKSVLLLVLAVTHLSLQAGPIFPRMTGAQVIEFTGPRPASTPGQAKWNFLEEQSANAYIDGVQDAAQGSAWCDTGRVKPHEIRDDVILALRKLPADRLKGSAAPLIIEFLRKKFPCGGRP